MTKPHDTIQEQSIVEENKSHFKIRKKMNNERNLLNVNL